MEEGPPPPGLAPYLGKAFGNGQVDKAWDYHDDQTGQWDGRVPLPHPSHGLAVAARLDGQQ